MRPVASRRMLLALPVLLAAALALWPRPASAQFRYLLSTDVHEQYDSNVFAGVGLPDWDMITEIEPGFRAYYYQRSALLWLHYRFMFQAFARTQDPAAGRKMIGYSNRLNFEYIKLLSPTTGLRFFTRFAQGTENVGVPGGIGPAGGIDAGFLTTGSSFFTDDLRLELQRMWNHRWSSRFWVDGNVYRAYGRSDRPNLIAPPDSWSIAPTHRLDYMLENDILSQETTFTALLESRAFYPTDLATLLVDLSGGWRHYFNDFWDLHLTAGVNIRELQVYDPASRRTWFQDGVGPLGTAAIRYRRGRELTVALEYAHVYALTVELGTSTSADTDEVMLLAEWRLREQWLFELATGFRYLRTHPPQANVGESSTKVVTTRAVAAYQIRSGITVDLSYNLELVRNRPVFGQTGQPGLGTLPSDYTRHVVGIGFSVAWPPVPPQDTQLSRRASENEPIFSLEAGGIAASMLHDADDLLLEQRAERARRERRSRDQHQLEPEQPQAPVEQLFDEPPAH